MYRNDCDEAPFPKGNGRTFKYPIIKCRYRNRCGYHALICAFHVTGIHFHVDSTRNFRITLYHFKCHAEISAQDLGASAVYAFVKVVLPEIIPGILSGFFFAFTVSMDDFVVTYFTKGAGINTISTMLYQQLRRGINPQMYALSTLLFLTILILLGLINHMSATKQKKADREEDR